MRPRRWLGVAVGMAALASALATTEAYGQTYVRSGFWVEGAWGAGTVRSGCSGCPDVTVAYGTSTHLRFGTSLAPRALIGLELFALHSTDLALTPGTEPVDAENGSIIPVVIWYAGPSGVFLKGGIGLARGTFTVRPTSDAPVTTERSGLAITFGVGYDLAVARRFALTANLGMNVTAIGDIPLTGSSVDDVIATVYEAAVGVTLR